MKLKTAAYLHNIGKIVLEPPKKSSSRLTGLEQEEETKHTTVGYRILNSFDNTMDLAECALTHHERWDGSGYPKGLKGSEIPLLARIIAVVESYDRMINNADGKRALEKGQAIEILREQAGTKFDPAIVSAFVEMLQSS